MGWLGYRLGSQPFAGDGPYPERSLFFLYRNGEHKVVDKTDDSGRADSRRHRR
jgi:hypothetical protein